MKFGINCELLQEPGVLVELAEEAERAGWDGFFIWDSMAFSLEESFPISDPWVVLGAIAVRTQRIRIGPMVTPLPRRRPWKLARETVSVDRLSNGRLILGLGLGEEPDFANFGEETDLRARSRQLEEGVALLSRLWSGERVDHKGEFYRVEGVQFSPRPVQSPRIPIWGGGTWPKRRPMRRAAAWDGVYPIAVENGKFMMTPELMREVINYVREQGVASSFDFVASGVTDGLSQAEESELIGRYEAAGATWYIESLDRFSMKAERMRARIVQGPPRAAS